MSYTNILAAANNEKSPEQKLQEFLIPGLSRSTVACIGGQDGQGKSYMTLVQLVAISCADPAADLMGLQPVHHGRVLMIEAEDDADTVNERVHAILKLIPKRCHDEIHSNLRIKILDGCDDGDGLGEQMTFDLLNDADALKIQQLAAGHLIVVLDTLSDFHNANGNDPSAMTEYMKVCEQISKRNKQVVMNVHQVTKASVRESESGSTVLVGAHAIAGKSSNIKLLFGLTSDEQKSLRCADGSVIPPDDVGLYVRVQHSKFSRGGNKASFYLKRNVDGVLLPIVLIAGVAPASRTGYRPKLAREAVSQPAVVENAKSAKKVRSTRAALFNRGTS